MGIFSRLDNKYLSKMAAVQFQEIATKQAFADGMAGMRSLKIASHRAHWEDGISASGSDSMRKHIVTDHYDDIEMARELSIKVRRAELARLLEQDAADEEAGLRAKGLATLPSDLTRRY